MGSVRSAEVIPLVNLFDDALASCSHAEEALKNSVPMHLLTGSKALFGIRFERAVSLAFIRVR